jgi:HSP20 family protein
MTELTKPGMFTRFEEELEDVMMRYIGRLPATVFEKGYWHPAIDIFRKEDFVLARIDLPGVDPKEVKISIEGSRLMIRGQRILPKELENVDECWFGETRQGHFHRVIELPLKVKRDLTSATYEHGVLTIKMPLEEEITTEEISIKEVLPE